MEATFLFLLLRLTHKSDERKVTQGLYVEPSELFIPIMVPLLSVSLLSLASSSSLFLLSFFLLSFGTFIYFYLQF